MDVILRDPLDVILKQQLNTTKICRFSPDNLLLIFYLDRQFNKMPIDKKYLASFTPDEYYHVYNRCPSHRKMFIDPADYKYFLRLLTRYLVASLDVYAYSLNSKSFSSFVKITEGTKQPQSDFDTNRLVTNQFRKLFITYSGYYNLKCKHMAWSSHGHLNEFKLLMIFNFHR